MIYAKIKPKDYTLTSVFCEKKVGRHLLVIETGMEALHQNLLVCDRIYLELIGQNRPDRLEELYTHKLKKFMKAMKAFLSVIRLEYAYYLLEEHNLECTAKSMAAFERAATKYPYPYDRNTERELMKIAEKICLGDADISSDTR